MREDAWVEYCCDGCAQCPIHGVRWHCTVCDDFDLCDSCHSQGEDSDAPAAFRQHMHDHPMTPILILPRAQAERRALPAGDLSGNAQEMEMDEEEMEAALEWWEDSVFSRGEAGMLEAAEIAHVTEQIDTQRDPHMVNGSAVREGSGERGVAVDVPVGANAVGASGEERADFDDDDEDTDEEEEGEEEDEGKAVAAEEGTSGRAAAVNGKLSERREQCLVESHEKNIKANGAGMVDGSERTNWTLLSLVLRKSQQSNDVFGRGRAALPFFRLLFAAARAALKATPPSPGPPHTAENVPDLTGLQETCEWLLERTEAAAAEVDSGKTRHQEALVLCLLLFARLVRFIKRKKQKEGSGPSSRSTGNAVEVPMGLAFLGNSSFLQSLLHVVRHLHRGGVSGKGESGVRLKDSLLNPASTLPPSAFFPFFPASLVQQLEGNPFGDLDKLLSGSALHFLANLVKYGTNMVSFRSHLSGPAWELCLCELLEVLPSGSRKYRHARRILLFLCGGSKAEYYKRRDSHTFSTQFKAFEALVGPSSEPGLETTALQAEELEVSTYDHKVGLIRCLSSIAKSAEARPGNWQSFCTKHTDAIPHLFRFSLACDDDCCLVALRLLHAAFWDGTSVLWKRAEDINVEKAHEQKEQSASAVRREASDVSLFVAPAGGLPAARRGYLDALLGILSSRDSIASSTSFLAPDSQSTQWASGLGGGGGGRGRGGGRGGGGRGGGEGGGRQNAGGGRSSEIAHGNEVGRERQASKGAESKRKKSEKVGDDGEKERMREENGKSGIWLSMMGQVAGIVASQKAEESLAHFIDVCLVGRNSIEVRGMACSVLQGIWKHSDWTCRQSFLACLVSQLPFVLPSGRRVDFYSQLLLFVLEKAKPRGREGILSEEDSLVKTFVEQCWVLDLILGCLRKQNLALSSHPNARVYNALRTVLDIDGCFLESSPCLVCNQPEAPFVVAKVESVREGVKFSDHQIFIKFASPQSIKEITLTLADLKAGKAVKEVKWWSNNRVLADASEMKSKSTEWQCVQVTSLQHGQSRASVKFDIPVQACNLMVDFSAFYESPQSPRQGGLQCPRCSHVVADRHGICSFCHENAHQCRQCRSINYDNLDAFLCLDCGFCKFARFELALTSRPSFTMEPITDDDDLQARIDAIQAEETSAFKKYQQLHLLKKPLLHLLSSTHSTIRGPELFQADGALSAEGGRAGGEGGEGGTRGSDVLQQLLKGIPDSVRSSRVGRRVLLIAILYGEKCRALFDSISTCIQTMVGLRKVVSSYAFRGTLHSLHEGEGDVGSHACRELPGKRLPSSTNCFGCISSSFSFLLKWIEVMVGSKECAIALSESGLLRDLSTCSIHLASPSERSLARSAIRTCVRNNKASTEWLNDMLLSKVQAALLQHRSTDIGAIVEADLLVLHDVCEIEDSLQASRLQVAAVLLVAALSAAPSDPNVCDSVTLSCLKILGAAAARRELQTSDANVKLMGSPSAAATFAFRWAQRVGRKKGSQETAVEMRGAGEAEVAALGIWSWTSSKGRMAPLLFCPSSDLLREEAAALIFALRDQEDDFLDLSLQLLPQAMDSGESSAEFFSFLMKATASNSAKAFLVVRGFFPLACRLVTAAVGAVSDSEHQIGVDFSRGFSLHRLLLLLSSFLSVPSFRANWVRQGLTGPLLEALLSLQSLQVQRSKLLSDCEKEISDFVASVIKDGVESRKQLVHACVRILHRVVSERTLGAVESSLLSTAFHPLTQPSFVWNGVEQLCAAICPHREELPFDLILLKSPSQEEFIRGSMTRNPYSASSMGALMRDVKNEICRQLELVSLLDDDYGMELLVGGKIIALDLPVRLVYQRIFLPSLLHTDKSDKPPPTPSTSSSSPPSPPMSITYRLQGLDGEATEPIVKEVEAEEAEEEDKEVEEAMVSSLVESGAVPILLQLLKGLRKEDVRKGHRRVLLLMRLLERSSRQKVGRTAMLRGGALPTLLHCARIAALHQSLATTSAPNTSTVDSLLFLVEVLAGEASEGEVVEEDKGGEARGPTSSSLVSSVANQRGIHEGLGEEAVKMFLEKRSGPKGAWGGGTALKSGRGTSSDEAIRILPFLTCGEVRAMEVLVDHFLPHLLDWGAFDTLQASAAASPEDSEKVQGAAEASAAVENFGRVVGAVRSDSNGHRLRSVVMQRGITAAAVSHLRAVFPDVREEGARKSERWAAALELPSVERILTLLAGLAPHHEPTQAVICQAGVVPLLHALESEVTAAKIGMKAEKVMDVLAEGEGDVCAVVGELREATKDEIRKTAARKKEELLKVLRTNRVSNDAAADAKETAGSPAPASLLDFISAEEMEAEDDEEEDSDALVCVVCREGYRTRPSEALGLYTFTKCVAVASPDLSGRLEQAYSSVSHFNAIHFQCHANAKRADASLKTPKREWEGAVVRNSETFCNGLFPVRGALVSAADYSLVCDSWWENARSVGRASGSRLHLLLLDISFILGRFALGISFSADSRGGGRESNAKFVFVQLQMAAHLVDDLTTAQSADHSSTLRTFLKFKGHPPPELGGDSSPQGVLFRLVLSLFFLPHHEWLLHRITFLVCCLELASKAAQSGVQGGGILPASFFTSPSRPSSSTLSHSRFVGHALPRSLFTSDGSLGSEGSSPIDLGRASDAAMPFIAFFGLIDRIHNALHDVRKRADVTDFDRMLTNSALLKSCSVQDLLTCKIEILDWLERVETAADASRLLDALSILKEIPRDHEAFKFLNQC